MYFGLKNINSTLFLTLLVGLGFGAPVAQAEIWKCGQKFFTTEENPGSNCQLVPASVLCGSDGNKYITPSDPSYKAVIQYCPTTGNSRSIYGRAPETDFLNPVTSAPSRVEAAAKNLTKGRRETQKLNPAELAKQDPMSILDKIMKDPESLSELAKFAFPSLQEDFQD
jgi:hypothetical protein